MSTILDSLRDLITRSPGRTERELAHALFGPGSYQQRVNSDCRLLVSRGVVRREGAGGGSDPYRYYPS